MVYGEFLVARKKILCLCVCTNLIRLSADDHDECYIQGGVRSRGALYGFALEKKWWFMVSFWGGCFCLLFFQEENEWGFCLFVYFLIWLWWLLLLILFEYLFLTCFFLIHILHHSINLCIYQHYVKLCADKQIFTSLPLKKCQFSNHTLLNYRNYIKHIHLYS